MKKCECYHENMRKVHRYDAFTGSYRYSVNEKYTVCWGTKECEECSCGGDKTKCSFYPEVRKKAKQEIAQNAKSKEHLALLEENEELKKELAALKEIRTPKKVVPSHGTYKRLRGAPYPLQCPGCGCGFTEYANYRACPNCGQLLLWNE